MKQWQNLACNEPLKGNRICLHRLAPDHASLLIQSFNNAEFWAAYRRHQNRDYTEQELINFLGNEYQQLPSQVGKIEWLISRISDSNSNSRPVPIGLACLAAFNKFQSRAEFMIGIFDERHRKTSAAAESSLLIMNYAFNKEKLNKLVSFVYRDNLNAQSSTVSLGFNQEGLLRSHIRSNDTSRFEDVYQNGMLVSDFRRNTRLSRLSTKLLGLDITSTPSAQKSERTAHFIVR